MLIQNEKIKEIDRLLSDLIDRNIIEIQSLQHVNVELLNLENYIRKQEAIQDEKENN